MDQIKKTLNQFGLSDSEVKVYLGCLKEDNLSPFKLANLTGIPRTSVYEILMSLSLKGLVTLETSDGFTKQQTRVKAKNPSVLRDILWKKRADIASLEVNIVDILPALKGDYHRGQPNADFQFYPGIEGAKKVYFGENKDNLSLPIHAFENLMSMDAFGKDLINQDTHSGTVSHLQTGIEFKELIGLNSWSRHALSYQVNLDQNYLKARQINYIDDPHFAINQRIVIQGSFVRISCIKNDEVWGLIINSPALAQTFESLFQALWKISSPVTLDLVKSWGKNEFLEAEKKVAK